MAHVRLVKKEIQCSGHHGTWGVGKRKDHLWSYDIPGKRFLSDLRFRIRLIFVLFCCPVLLSCLLSCSAVLSAVLPPSLASLSLAETSVSVTLFQDMRTHTDRQPKRAEQGGLAVNIVWATQSVLRLINSHCVRVRRTSTSVPGLCSLSYPYATQRPCFCDTLVRCRNRAHINTL